MNRPPDGQSSIIMPKTIDASDITKDAPRPPRWTRDPLTEHLERAHRNRLATFVNKRDAVEKLIEVDAAFYKIATGGGGLNRPGWINPASPVGASLFMRTHAAYRGACEHGFAGELSEVYPQVRVCLEYAGYALRIHEDAQLADVWLNRNRSDADKRDMKGAFLIREVKDTIARLSPDNAKVFDTVYEQAIEFGGHPNVNGVSSNMRLVEEADRSIFEQIYLHGDNIQLDLALKTIARAGVCALGLFHVVFQPRFMFLEVETKLPALRQGL